MKERIIRFKWGTKRENLNFLFGQRERKTAKNRGICAAHTCIPQYREYPPRGVNTPTMGAVHNCNIYIFIQNITREGGQDRHIKCLNVGHVRTMTTVASGSAAR